MTIAVLATTGGLTACDSLKTTLLEAKDPDIIDPSSVQSAAGANAVRSGRNAAIAQPGTHGTAHSSALP